MRSIDMQLPKLSNTKIVALGVATGALTGVAGLTVYGLLAGKGVAAAWMAKATAAGAGAVGGGVSSLGVASELVSQQEQAVSEDCEAKNRELHAQVTELAASLEAEQLKVEKTDGGQLESIKGIGPKFATLLQTAGIHTLEDLAKADYDQLHVLLSSSSGGQLVKLESWISQAQLLTKT